VKILKEENMSEIRRTSGGPSGVPQTDTTVPVQGGGQSTQDSTAPQQTAGGSPTPDPKVVADKLLELSLGTMGKVVGTILDGGPLKDKNGNEQGGMQKQATQMQSAPQVLKVADELVKKGAEEVAKLAGDLATSGDPHRVFDELKKL